MSKDPYLKRLESLFSTVEPVEPEPANGKAAPPAAELNGLRARVAELEASLTRAQRAAEERDLSAADTLRARIAELEASLAEAHSERERSADRQMQAQQRAESLSAQVAELESKLGMAQAQVAVSGSLQAEAQSRVEFLQSRVSQLEIALAQSHSGEAAPSDTELIKFKLGIERSSDAIFITDADGNIIFANPAFEKVYGFTREEAIGRTPRIIKSGVIPPEGYKQFWSTLLSKGTVAGEIVNKTKDGRLVTIEGSNNPILDDAGNIIGFLAIHRDISERKAAERRTRLQASALDAAANAIVITNRSGAIEWVNPAFTKNTGYTLEEAVGNNPRLLKSGAHDQGYYQNLWETVLAGKVWRGEVVNRRKDGTMYPEEMTITPVADESGQISHFIAVKQDISERKRAEAAVREREEDLAILLEFSPEAVGVVNTRTGLFESVNAAAEWLFGMPRDELVKVGPTQMSPDFQPDGRRSAEKMAEKIREALSGGTPVFEWAHRNTVGRIIPCEVRLVGLTGARSHLVRFSVTDITQRKQTEAALSKRAVELEAIARVSAAASSILDTDVLLQTVVDLTKSSFNLYHAHIYLLNDTGDMLELVSGAGATGRVMVAEGRHIPFNAEHSLVARAAQTRQAVVANNIQQERGFLPHPLLPNTRSELAIPMVVGDLLLGVFDVQADVIDRFTEDDIRLKITLAEQVAVALQNARLYAEQAATVERLRELDQLKSSFLANMSHKLRTPLNSILGFTQVLLEGIDGDINEWMENDLIIVQKNGQHLLNLISDILDMAKIEAGKMTLNPEIFDLKDVLDEVIDIASPLARVKSLDLLLDTGDDATMDINADRMRLRQVMINIVNNAIKFTDSGCVSIRAERLNAHIRISVRDTGIGIGIDASHIETIFQEFSQVDSSTTRKVGGTGLGLPISRHLIELHGGRLWAESTGVPGEGSTFIIELPVETTFNENM